MAILDYTTKISANQTVNEIHQILAKAGANAILNEYDSAGDISAIRFRVPTKQGQIYFQLPANVAGVSNALKKDREYRDEAHAKRVAWRIVKDWIEAQMAIINAQMAELYQVFLPYAQTNNGQTVYERLQTDGLKMLSLTSQ
jgi:hypothetical protein